MHLVVYTDGSCAPKNPGYMGGGASVYIKTPEGRDNIEREGISLSLGWGTNNRAEMLAVLHILNQTPVKKGAIIDIRSDSKYVISNIERLPTWWKFGRLKSTHRNQVKNADLWLYMYYLIHSKHQYASIITQWIPAHTGRHHNELADDLAKQGAEKQNDEDLDIVLSEDLLGGVDSFLNL